MKNFKFKYLVQGIIEIKKKTGKKFGLRLIFRDIGRLL